MPIPGVSIYDRRVVDAADPGRTCAIAAAASRQFEYRPRREMTAFGDARGVPVLLWHGRGPNERDVLALLAAKLAKLGCYVFVPDWDSTAPDGGAADLTASLDFAGSRSDARLIVVGWSLGGTAAVGLAFGSHATGLPIGSVIGLAMDARARDRVSGQRLADLTEGGVSRVPVTLVHGLHDFVVPMTSCVDFVARRSAVRDDLSFVRADTDHAGVIGTQYDFASRRCLPAVTTYARVGLRATCRAVGAALV